MKSVIRVLMLGLLVGGFSLGLVACGGDETPPVEETPAMEESPDGGVVEEVIEEEVVEEPAEGEATPDATESPEGAAEPEGTSN
ncbi:hypothetical protein L3556_14560 [Candidatus Synechococcus calcipolaris G9]|uniref:Uncharacterized protein n=1 Tax=Candidatus Synechococcus calcipolaris G9 TaxID=1497997 RepID=A0ABT6F2Q3_9SYNE|nr:hypothetical protein [Candidatus Synechococcus calcipolaris]MDG2992142.1 hypothetical protein [Candidatus Synechococcus calcipolaris G9]